MYLSLLQRFVVKEQSQICLNVRLVQITARFAARGTWGIGTALALPDYAGRSSVSAVLSMFHAPFCGFRFAHRRLAPIRRNDLCGRQRISLLPLYHSFSFLATEKNVLCAVPAGEACRVLRCHVEYDKTSRVNTAREAENVKKLVKLIVENKSCIPEYTAQLYSVFGDAVTVRAFTIDDSAAYADQSEDAILTSASSAVNFSEIKKVHFRGKKWIPINLSLQRKSLLQLNAYPKGTQALLVNLSKRMAEELQCEYVLKTSRFFNYFEKQHNTSAGVSILVAENQTLERRLGALVQLSDEGLLGINADGEILECNFQAADILQKPRGQLLRSRLPELLPPEMAEHCRTQQTPISRVISFPGGTYTVRMTPITQGTQYLGAYVLLSPPEPEGPPRAKPASGKGHVAKYRFSDICGGSAQIRQTVELARKMARTESSVLITGESGTGKELFAHAIHNSSPRAAAPFVAINCAALPDSLLESELFGYEDGAFTGARKGGKAGLFELASSGSIFLDEIEGMAPGTQLKLLRVIQEREMMRVGGDRVIPIDVRIISASNQDLTAMMEEGRFRSDLFYRVSTLPLDLPPLRRRREDILTLIEEFKSTLRLAFVLTEETKALLLRYSWPGNIRELRNCVEYLGCQNLPVIEPENLPYTIRRAASAHGPDESGSQRLQDALLYALAEEHCGRKQLQHILTKRGLSVSESQLRRELEQMKARGWITSGTGRGGSRLTDVGLQEYKNRSK